MIVTTSDLLAILPLIIVATTALVVMLAIAVRRVHRLTASLTLTGLTLAFVSLFVAARFAVRSVTPLLIVDGLGLAFLGLILAAGLVVTLFTYVYLERGVEQRDEHYLLLLIAILGTMVLAMSVHWSAFFLGLETLGVALYSLIAYQAAQPRAIEAGIKYFTLAALSTAFVAFGIALIYADTGSLELDALTSLATEGSLLTLAGIVLVLVGIAFKLALVPFHQWSPDVYQGAAAPVTALIATISKAGVFAFFLRTSVVLALPLDSSYGLIVAVLAVASMFIGNLLALRQQNFKRLLAYSSVAHMGYLLIAVFAFETWALMGAIVYLAAYFVAVLAALGVLITLSGPTEEAETLEPYRGLFWRRPWLAAVLTLSMLSLAGFPLTAGFMGKVILVAGGIGNTLWGLVISLILSSIIGVYYYLRVIVVMFAPLPEGKTQAAAPAVVPWSAWLGLAGLTVLLLWIGIYPSPFFATVEIVLGLGR